MVNREHKDRLFSFIFGREENKKWTLELYNAGNGSSYTESEEIEITTIEDAVYMGMKNDVSFLLHWLMSIYEQQSTYNPNMPLRELMYVGKLYDKYIHRNGLNIYGREVVQIPVPKLVVFYNGTEEKADDMTLELKEAFPQELRDGVTDIDVRVRMLNINKGRNKAIMQACGPLMEYAWLVEEIRENSLHMDIERAVDCAIDSVPENFELRKFLIGHKAEVKDMCITEYNEAETMRMIELAGEKRGEERGKKIGEKQGEDKLGRLIEELLSKGRTEDVQRVATDKNARVILYKEFNIE